ncbi:MAG TPA: DUF6015 family protein [Thermoplasmata archaeon]|nr:DUF6015 family protein [Thermoplasmata archaeon]
MGAITEDELTRAIERTLVPKGTVPAEEARKVARIVLNYFGLDDSVLDNKLSSEDRDHFYRLEEEGLLTSEEEDATVSRGKTWRIHYWLLKKDRIRDVGREVPRTEEPGADAVYRSMADSAWVRGASERGGPKAPPVS